jgi:hypothetical protein
MAKTKKGDGAEMINGNVALPEDLRPVQQDLVILGAKISDDFCSYSYKYLTGPQRNVPQDAKKGIYIIDKDMKYAFARFNVHLACIDDLFKIGKVEVADIDMFHDHDFTQLIEVTEFKIFGDQDNETIVLIGTKHVSSNNRIKVESYKIPLDSLSSYKWYNELKDAADVARKEVQLYMDGKYTIPESQVDEEEEGRKAKKKQTKLKFEKPVGEEASDQEDTEPAFSEDTDFEDQFGEAKL